MQGYLTFAGCVFLLRTAFRDPGIMPKVEADPKQMLRSSNRLAVFLVDLRIVFS